MARILLVNQYYWPDLASTGQHLTDLAEHLAAKGHEVQVLCSRGRYLEGGGDAPRREERNGVHIERVGGTRFGQRGRFLGRVLDYAAFHAAACFRVALSRWPDVVVTLTTPPLLGLWGALARRLGRVKHVQWVMDLHPEAEFELGLVQRRSLLGRLLSALARIESRGADRCVVLGPYQGRRVVERGQTPENLVEIPVWSDGSEIRPVPHAQNPARAELGFEGRFTVLYSGNAGLVHRFEEVIEAAALVAERDPAVHFAFIGGGPRRAEIEQACAERGLHNVSFRGYLPREALGGSLPAADVHLVTLRPEHTGVAVPGKLYGILAAGRPVLFVGAKHCESADAVRDARAGFTFKPGQGTELAQAILELHADRELRERLGENARRAFLAHYDRAVCCERWTELLEELTGLRPPRVHHTPEAARTPRERRQRDPEAPPAALPARPRGQTHQSVRAPSQAPGNRFSS
jgi:colanic acid biosynthesis glycosyl transferase WcaI